MLLMACMDSDDDRKNRWFFDSGCSNHMSGDLSKFSQLDDKYQHSVKLGNNYKMKIHGKGRVKLCVNGIKHILTDVFYVPGLTNNLLSVGQLQERGIGVLMQSGKCKVYHPEKGLICETIISTNRMFSIVA